MISRLHFEQCRLWLDEQLLRKGYVRIRTRFGWSYLEPEKVSSETVSEIVRGLAGDENAEIARLNAQVEELICASKPVR